MFNTIHEVMYEVYKDEQPTGIRVGFLYDSPYGEDPKENENKLRKLRYLLELFSGTNGYKLWKIYDQEV